MFRTIHRSGWYLLLALLPSLVSVSAVSAQTTSFTYQGRLTSSGTPATGTYDLQFALWDNSSGGTQIGVTETVPTVAVSVGLFSVQLDFGANAFSGALRFLEIAAKLSGAGSYTTLSPRQPLTSTPYAIRSGHATLADTAADSSQLGGVLANQFVQKNDSRLIDARPPTAGSSDYVQNTNSPQAANFNISGNGVIGGNLIAGGNVGIGVSGPTEVLHLQRAGSASILLDVGATSNTGQLHIKRGSGDSYVGPTGSFFDVWTFENIPLRIAQNGIPRIFVDTNGNAGIGTLTPSARLDVAGSINTSTQYNIGGSRVLTAAGTNILAGFGAGAANTGTDNAFLGVNAGYGNIQANNNTGSGDTFAGAFAGQYNIDGSHNTFVGYASGQTSFSSPDGQDNTFIGSNATGDFALTNATAIGNKARVNRSNSLVLGSINGVNAATADTKVGIGTTTPSTRLHVVANGIIGVYGANTNTLRVGNQPGVYGAGNADDGVWAISGSGNGLNAQSSTGAAGLFTGTTFFKGDTTPLAPAFGAGVALGYGSTGYVFAYNYSTGTTQNLILNGPGGNVGIGTTGPARTLHVEGRARIAVIPPEASVASVCFNAQGDLLQCGASSLRWKSNVRPFPGGLDIVRRLRPISFTWKDGGLPDIGLGAEDVAKVAPSLTFFDSKGKAEGVKYERLNMVLINAVKEQQHQIEALQAQNAALNARLRAVEESLRK